MFKIESMRYLAFIGIFLSFFFSSCGSSPGTDKIISSTFDPAPIFSLEEPTETSDAQSTVLSDTATEEYASSPLPESEHINDGRKLVTGVVDAVDNIDIQYSSTNEESEMIQKVLFGEDAQEFFILIDSLDCIAVPNPLHYEMFEMDSAITIKVNYIDNTLDVILSGGESKSKLSFYRLLPEVGDFGDYGYIFSHDEESSLTDAVMTLIND